MPLPHVLAASCPQCRARAKHSGARCMNPAAFGMPVCRVHGARRQGTIRSGPDHPQYRHGGETQTAKSERSMVLAELRDLEATMVQIGALVGPRWRGRKPGKMLR
jgi:hypothetical protein